jgi:hypothetical protein
VANHTLLPRARRLSVIVTPATLPAWYRRFRSEPSLPDGGSRPHQRGKFERSGVFRPIVWGVGAMSDKAMAHTTTGRSDQRRGRFVQRPAAPRTAGTVVDNRPGAVAQRQLTGAVGTSPRVLAWQVSLRSLHNSPRLVAQRRQLRRLFGRAIQRKGGSEKTSLARLLEFLPGLEAKDLTIVKDDPSMVVCHDYALKGTPLASLLLARFVFARSADEIEYSQRNDYDTVIAAFSSDGVRIDHSARYEPDNDRFVHKLQTYPYFACDPVKYQAASRMTHLWFYGLPRRAPLEESVPTGGSRRLAQRPFRGRQHPGVNVRRESKTDVIDNLDAMSPEDRSGLRSTEPEQPITAHRPNRHLAESAHLRLDDAKKTSIAVLQKGDVVTIKSSTRAGSRFSLGPFSISKDHVWVETMSGQEGWVRTDAIRLNG